MEGPHESLAQIPPFCWPGPEDPRVLPAGTATVHVPALGEVGPGKTATQGQSVLHSNGIVP